MDKTIAIKVTEEEHKIIKLVAVKNGLQLKELIVQAVALFDKEEKRG